MNAATKLSLFAAGLVAVGGAAFAVGQTTDDGQPAPAGHVTHGSPTTPGHGAGHGAGHDAGHGAPSLRPAAGLSAEQEGYRLALDQTTLPRGQESTLSFQVTGADGVVTRYTETHERELHLIVVRRDLTGFQHLHPTRDEAGRWSVPLTLDGPGPYKVYADFAPADRTDPVVLAGEVTVPGDYRPLPADGDSDRAVVGSDTVTLEGALAAGEPSTLSLEVTRDGRPVTLQPYLGALGHLVVIRASDLAYLHVHPEDDSALRFVTDVPTAGRYAAFLDYRHDDQVRTAAFSLTAD